MSNQNSDKKSDLKQPVLKATRIQTAESQRRSANRITLIGTAIGAVFGIMGAFIGGFYLASLWGVATFAPSFYYSHPDLEVFGFLPIFVLGAAFTIVPRFKNRNLLSTKAAGASLGFFAAANIIWLLFSAKFIVYADLLVVAGSIIGLALLSLVLKKPNGPLGLAEPFLWLSPIPLVAASVFKVYLDYMNSNPAWDSFPFLLIALAAFPSMMIFGIQVRTVHFRLIKLRKKFVRASFYSAVGFLILESMALLADSLSYLQNVLTLIGSFLFGVSCITILIALSALRENVSKDLFAKMNERDRVRYFYFRNSLRIASYWLVVSTALAMVFSLSLFHQDPGWGFWVRDAFIHSIAVGFLASAIAGYSPILLPSILSSRAPYHGLTNIPIYIVAAGNGWRILGDAIQALGYASVNSFTGYSGVVVIFGMMWFVVMNHRLK